MSITITLASTQKITKGTLLTLQGYQYNEVDAIGDGNCAFNSAALAIIDLIKRDQLLLSDEQFNTLLRKIREHENILRERIKFYRGQSTSLQAGAAYSDLIYPLETFIEFINQATLTKEDFIACIKSTNDRIQIGALHVGLAPALRSISADIQDLKFAAVAKVDDAVLTIDAKNLRNDGVEAGEELLAPLMHDFFKINSNFFDAKNPGRAANNSSVILGAPEVAFKHTGNHWSYLMTAGQNDGLATCLSNAITRTPLKAAAINETEKNTSKETVDFDTTIKSIEAIVNDKFLPENKYTFFQNTHIAAKKASAHINFGCQAEKVAEEIKTFLNEKLSDKISLENEADYKALLLQEEEILKAAKFYQTPKLRN